jgi:hypothetical protein
LVPTDLLPMSGAGSISVATTAFPSPLFGLHLGFSPLFSLSCLLGKKKECFDCPLLSSPVASPFPPVSPAHAVNLEQCLAPLDPSLIPSLSPSLTSGPATSPTIPSLMPSLIPSLTSPFPPVPPAHVVNLEQLLAPLDPITPPWLSTYGTMGGGLELMRVAWPRLQHVFAVQSSTLLSLPGPQPVHVVAGPRFGHTNFLALHPVDLLIVERSHISCSCHLTQAEDWEHLIQLAPHQACPQVVVESWQAGAISWPDGPADKGSRSRWLLLGYGTCILHVNALSAGGAIDQA